MHHPSGMLIQSGGSKPFVVSLMKLLGDKFPFIIFKMGGFVDRDVRGQPGKKSAHAEGRAIDIYLNVKHRQEKALGKLLFEMFKDKASKANTDNVIFDGMIWNSANGVQTTAAAKVRDIHDDHVHVDFDSAHVAGSADALSIDLDLVRERMKRDYKDWVGGYYGPAFNPLSNNTHLTNDERVAIYHMNKGTTSMSVDPGYLKAITRVLKWRTAGKLPDPSDS